MENYNIPYRKLRDTTRAKTGKVSESLWPKKPSSTQNQRSNVKKKEFSMMTQNVTRYEHMLKHPHTKQNYIDWIVKLRQPIEINKKQSEAVEYNVPSVFNKTTESRDNFLKARHMSMKTFNSAEFQDVLSRKENHGHVQEKTLDFMTSLRTGYTNLKTSQNRPVFNNIPLKDRHEFPTFLTKDSIKKVTNITKTSQQSGFDGSQNFPTYPMKIQEQKNFGLLSVFTIGNRKPSLPTLAWQMGLRH